jgi:regulatory protein
MKNFKEKFIIGYNKFMTYTITSIAQAKKRETRVNLELDGQFWVGMDKNDLLRFNLFKGKEISDDDKKIIEKAVGDSKLLEKVINYINVRPRSTKEVRDYLVLKRGIDKEEANAILNKLEEKGYLSDENFANWYIENRLNFGVHGENKIRSELFKKGVSKSIIESVLSKLLKTNEGQADQQEKIKEFITKNIKTIKYSDKNQLKQKLIQRLASRGFSYSDIIKAIKEQLKS